MKLISAITILGVVASSASASIVPKRSPVSGIVGTRYQRHQREATKETVAAINTKEAINNALLSSDVDSKVLEIRAGSSEEEAGGLAQTLKVGFYFGLWYALNIIYNSKWLHRLRQSNRGIHYLHSYSYTRANLNVRNYPFLFRFLLLFIFVKSSTRSCSTSFQHR